MGRSVDRPNIWATLGVTRDSIAKSCETGLRDHPQPPHLQPATPPYHQQYLSHKKFKNNRKNPGKPKKITRRTTVAIYTSDALPSLFLYINLGRIPMKSSAPRQGVPTWFVISFQGTLVVDGLFYPGGVKV
jgi:hypothetical protein